MQKTFLLGLGAQKAGTTWVYQYLRGHPDCALGGIKEMASLNVHFGANPDAKRRFNRIKWLQEALERADQDLKAGELSEERALKLLDGLEQVAADFSFDCYLRYFTTQFQQKPEAMLTADITPEYCMMTQSSLEQTKSQLENAGYRVKALFLMRDPVERCYSALRMGYRRALKNGSPIYSLPHEDFVKKAIAPWQRERTQYENIVPRIERSFPPEDRFFGFFETFFTDENVAKLCDFLGISQVEANLAKRINTSPRAEEPSREDWEETRAAYKETYDYCADRFGSELVSSIWHNRC